MMARFSHIAALLAAAVLSACATPLEPSGTALFNGRDFAGWELVTVPATALADTFTLRPDGVIASTGQPTGYLATTSSFRDYRLHVEWRWSGKPGNGGVLLHIVGGPKDRAWPVSIQVQTKAGNVGDILPMAGATFNEPLTSAPGASPAIKGHVAPDSELAAGQWNSCDVVSQGGVIDVTINGVLQNHVSGATPAAGRVGFQLEGAPFELRNVRISGEPVPSLPAAVNTDPARAQVVLPEPADARLPSIFLIGDSTVRNGKDDGQGKGAEGQWGWGNPIARWFDTSKINVVNRAVGGLSSRTYLTSGHWDRTAPLIKAGDVVLIQFGHNDSGAINDTSRARATIKGVGEETEEIDNLLTLKHEVVHTYGWYLRQYVRDIKARGAVPVLVSPIPRKSWDVDGRVQRARNDYAGWVAQVAQQEQVGFIDLNESAARRYDEIGRDAVMKLFPAATPDERIHTNLAGAEMNAQLVVQGLKAVKGLPALPLLAAPRPREDERPVVDASKVTDENAANPALPTLFIVGDSTVKSGGQNGMFGWGERLAPYFDQRKINIVNQAIGGRSSRTYFTEGRWDKVAAQLKAGDVVLIQFGHNDGGRIGDPAMKNRASAPGIGADTVTDTRADGSMEQVHSFGWYMAKYVADARAKGARVVLLSPVPHKDKWQGERDFASFAQWDRAVAQAGGAQFIDLTLLVSDAYRALGADKVATLFADARTHTNDAGAQFNAARVVDGLKSLNGNPLAPYLRAP